MPPNWKRSAWRRSWARAHGVRPRPRKPSRLQARNRSREADGRVSRPALTVGAGRCVNGLFAIRSSPSKEGEWRDVKASETSNLYTWPPKEPTSFSEERTAKSDDQPKGTTTK